jgi:hypothetical protein
MLNIFPSVTVPGVENVTLYHDDSDPNLFYMVSNMPVFKTGVDAKPMLRLLVIGRDFYLFKDKSQDLSTAETELGVFNMTTALEVSQADQDKIRAYLASLRNYPRPYFNNGRVGFQIVSATANPAQIKLTYPEWTTPAKVTFSIAGQGAGDTFVKAQTGSDAPSLLTDCTANYQATLGQEGVELLRQALSKGYSAASVWYQVSFVARMPAINISITGDASNVYKDIKNYIQVHETYSGSKNGSWSYPAVSDLNQLKTISSSLHIEFDDNDFTQAAGSGTDIEKQIENFVFTTATNYIQNIFFAAPFSPGVPTAELGTDPLQHNPWKDPNAPPTAANQLWLKNFTQDMEGSFGFSATYNKNFVVTKNPSSTLEGMISKEDYQAAILEADLSVPYFQILDAQVAVTADFANDPIAAIIVHCEYKQTDETTGMVRQHSDDFKFTTGQEQYRFQAFMAKAKDGTPKDEYTYTTQLIYKYSAEPVSNPPVTTNTRELFLGYESLSCVRVSASLGSVPTDTVSRVQVHFEYPDPNLKIPSKSQDSILSPEHPSDIWFTYTGNNPSTEYTYQCTYFLTNGETIQGDVQRSNSKTCLISAPFEDTLNVTFVPQGQFPPTQQIVVSTAYADTNGYRETAGHSFTSLRDTWNWQVRLRDKTKRTFQYKVDTTFIDGSSDTGDWKDGTEGTILVGQLAQKIIEVDVVPSLIDFTKTWKLVIVKLKYSDGANGVDQEQTFQISAQNASAQFPWRFPVKDQKNKTYTYEVDAYGIDPTQKKMVGPTSTDNSALVIEL